MNKTPLALMLITLSAQAIAAAGDSNTSKSDLSESSYNPSLLNVPISDTRSPLNTKSAISSTTYISKAQIKKSGAHTLDQILQEQAGFTVSRNGGPGSTTSLFLRGSEADAILVLLNDIKIQSVNTGFSAITELPLSSIDRIEIIRGPQSTIYGSAAPGGIIKIYTTPQTQRTTFNLSESASDQGDLQTALGGSTGFGNVHVFGNANWSTLNGIDVCSDPNTCFVATPEDDLDGFEQLNGQAGFQVYGENGNFMQLSHMYNKARVEFDSDFQNESVSEQNITNFQLKGNINETHSIRFDAGQFLEDYLGTYDKNGPVEDRSIYGTERYSSSLVHEMSSTSSTGRSRISLTSGIDYEDATLVDFASGLNTNFISTLPEIDRQTTGAFTEFEYYENGATIRLGIRRDMYRETNDDLSPNIQKRYATTGHMKLQLALDDRWTIKSSLGRNFNMPTFADLYFPFSSNPNLEPEIHVSQDIGIEYAGDRYKTSLFFYRTKSRNLIVYNSNTSMTENIRKVKIQGIELMQSYQINNFYANANISYLDARNDVENEPNYHLPRRPELQFSGNLNYTFKKFTGRFGMLTASKRYDDFDNSTEVGGYTIFNLGLTHQTTEELRLGVRLDNMFDKDYETVYGYNQPERTVWFDIEYAIQ